MGAVIIVDRGLCQLEIVWIFDVCKVVYFRLQTWLGPSGLFVVPHCRLQISSVSMGGSRGMQYIKTMPTLAKQEFEER